MASIRKVTTMLDQEVDDETPFQKSLAQLGKYIGIAAVAVCVIIFAIGVFQGSGRLASFCK